MGSLTADCLSSSRPLTIVNEASYMEMTLQLLHEAVPANGSPIDSCTGLAAQEICFPIQQASLHSVSVAACHLYTRMTVPLLHHEAVPANSYLIKSRGGQAPQAILFPS